MFNKVETTRELSLLDLFCVLSNVFIFSYKFILVLDLIYFYYRMDNSGVVRTRIFNEIENSHRYRELREGWKRHPFFVALLVLAKTIRSDEKDIAYSPTGAFAEGAPQSAVAPGNIARKIIIILVSIRSKKR